MAGSTRKEFLSLSHDWDRAMIQNDAEAIGRFMADDWTIVGSDGNVGDKPTFLALIKSGLLTHDVMESHEVDVRIYGDTAVVIARGISGGKYQGQAFREVERVSCVYLHQSGEWKCVHTHLSRLTR